MLARPGIILSLAIAAGLGCSGDRATGPSQTEAEQAATEFERVASELGSAAGPAGFLTYASAAAALRSGAPVSKVDITVDGVTEEWSAFGHELRFDAPPGVDFPDLQPPAPLRALLAWRPSPAGLRVVHLLSADDDGPIGRIELSTSMDPATLTLPSFLMYAEGRDVRWRAVTGEQSSRLVGIGGACPDGPRPSLPYTPRPSCVQAGFTFAFSGVQAEAFVFGVGPGPVTLQPSGTRTLSMRAQSVAGVSLTLALGVVVVPPIATRSAR